MADRIIAGAMSGTSADGVDVAIVRVRGRGLSMTADLLHHHAAPYPPKLRQAIFKLRSSAMASLGALARIGREITLAYAQASIEAFDRSRVSPQEIAAIAAHGQTLFHDPPLTLQWFDPSLLAARTRCAVVSDFRRADCAAGGQGAPLVPFADYILFRHPTKHRVLLNIGGIANLTHLSPGGTIDRLVAFDTGPGNCISDWICRTHEPGGEGIDADGRGASAGRVLPEVLARFLDDPFFRAAPPKSTDGPAMIAAFERAVSGKPYQMHDLLCTAVAATVETIFLGIHTLRVPRGGLELIASGGGTRNLHLMHSLRLRADGAAALQTTDDVGVPSEAKEAIAFALLGAATLDGEPSNVPSVTGARQGVILGSITPRPL